MPAILTQPLLERTVLDNGLRVVIAPDHAAPVVAVAVVYDVGFRSEPEGRTGFAHLFEHLMFQGSANVAKMEHGRLVQGAGGAFNGHTRPDLTSYYEAIPANALELALFLESDRMAALQLDQENLDNQIAVVEEEIRVNVLNRPYGGFPWIDLPGLAFDTFANSHNGYGSFEDLDHATLEDAESFYRDYYAPANAVLVLAGDLEVASTFELVERYFGGIQSRPAPKRPDFSEPPITSLRHRSRFDQHAPTPAAAIGFRAPDPVKELGATLASAVLAATLGDGDASRLRRRLVYEERTVTDLSCYLGTFSDPLSMRDPLLFQVVLFHSGKRSAEQLTQDVLNELASLERDGPEDSELGRVTSKLIAERWHEADRLLERALGIADVTVIHDRPDLYFEIPAQLSKVDAEQVKTAARRLLSQMPCVVEILPSDSQVVSDRNVGVGS
ncbi:MAG: insulinase family protein [Actinobacteria bacterium]|nr:insulinase family protein [Actinomycetota bacterium]